MTADGDRVPLRERTAEELLALVRAGGASTRQELVNSTRMARSTVNQAVARLIREGRITESDRAPKGPGSGSGRPAVRLVAVVDASAVAGIDFGHAHVQVAVADEQGAFLGHRIARLDVDAHAPAALDLAATMLDGIVRTTGVTLGSVVAGVPGPRDARTGAVTSPTILSSWVGLHPGAELTRRLALPVRVENDAVLGAYGEARHGAGRGRADFLYVKASHGIGAGLVVGGRLYTGATGIAGEIGHIGLPGRLESCRCGKRGCLEAVVSVEAVRARVALVDPTRGVADVLLDRRGGPVVERVAHEAGRTLGTVLAQLCDLLNPGALVLGGELATVPGFVDGVRAAVERDAQPAIAATVEVRAAALGDRAELHGALELAAASSPARADGDARH
jgi:predicted NBD/HSP70 family sugar kinase